MNYSDHGSDPGPSPPRVRAQDHNVRMPNRIYARMRLARSKLCQMSNDLPGALRVWLQREPSMPELVEFMLDVLDDFILSKPPTQKGDR